MRAQSDINALRQAFVALQPAGFASGAGRFCLGASGPDEALGGGLGRGALHEIVAAEHADIAAAAGFAAALCMRAAHHVSARDRHGRDTAFGAAGHGREIVWIRERPGEIEAGKLYPPGMAEMGLRPDRVIHVRLKEARDVLRAGAEAASCGALGAVVIEPWGDPPVLDLTASRKLQLAAQESGVPLFLLRSTMSARATAAATRWSVRSAPSRPLEANAPGNPVFDVGLTRQRAGRDGLSWRMEWNRDDRIFAEAALLQPVVPLAADGTSRPRQPFAWRRAG